MSLYYFPLEIRRRLLCESMETRIRSSIHYGIVAKGVGT